MVSRNAFRLASTTTRDSAPGAIAPEGSLHAKKRQKLEELEANIHSKTADRETALEVDHMILDYLAYQSTVAILASREQPKRLSTSLELNLSMTDHFLAVFKSKYPDFVPDAKLRFSLLLLKFSTMFTCRLRRDSTAPSLQALTDLREANHKRAMSWMGPSDRMPSDDHDVTALDTRLPMAQGNLERNRAHVLNALGMPAEDEDYEDAFYGTDASLALLDILPAFMAMSAARNAICNSNLKQQWMHLAGNFMLQACLEQYLARGAYGSDAVDEAFSWGYKPDAAQEACDSSSQNKSNRPEREGITNTKASNEINDMFKADDDIDHAEVRNWATIKSKYLAELLTVPGAMDLSSHLESVASNHSVRTFESSVLDFAKHLLASVSAPLLTQLERGCLDDMNTTDTEQFLHSCGLTNRWASMGL